MLSRYSILWATTLSLLSIVFASPVPVAAIAGAVTIDTTWWYTLRNDYTGTSQVLDVKNDLLQISMKPKPSVLASGMYWKFISASSSPPKYHLRTLYQGDGKSLDVWNDNGVSSTDVRLRDTGNHSGQFWSILPLSDGSFRLVNDYTGAGLHLDVYADTVTGFLGTDDASGQHWHFDRIRKISA